MRRLSVGIAVGILGCSSSSSSSDRCSKGPTSDAQFLWSLAVDHAHGGDVAALPSGDLVVAAIYGGATTFGGKSLPAGSDLAVARLAPSGSVAWTATFDTQGATFVSVTTDDRGDVLVFGGTQGKSFTLAGKTFTNAPSKFSEATFVVKLSGADGSAQWAQAFVGSSASTVTPAYVRPSAARTRGGIVVVVGGFGDSATFGSGTLGPKGGGFVARLSDADGGVSWSRAIGDQVFGVELSASGDVIVDAEYAGTIAIDPAPAPPTLPDGSKSIVFAKLAAADGTPTSSTWLALNAGETNASASRLAFVPSTGDVVFLGTGHASIGGQAIANRIFLAALDDGLQVAWSTQADGASQVAPGGSARVAVTGSFVASHAGGSVGLGAATLPTPTGAEATTVLITGVFDATNGSLVRGWDVPPTGQVQNGDRGSLRPNGVAMGNDGRVVVSADLDGLVNLDRCDVTVNPTDTTLVVFAVAP